MIMCTLYVLYNVRMYYIFAIEEHEMEERNFFPITNEWVAFIIDKEPRPETETDIIRNITITVNTCTVIR